MIRYECSSAAGERLVRITKAQAMKAYGNRETIGLTPSNLSPVAFGGAFLLKTSIPDIAIDDDRLYLKEEAFHMLNRAFKAHNCVDAETGHGINYWKVT